MDLDELRALIAVAETGSFSGAAKSLNFARATLRKRVDELEARSGVKLLKRAADGATMTKAGELLANKGRQILGETRELLSAVRALESQRDLVTVEIPFGQPPEVERAAHVTFRKAAPNLRWKIRYSSGKFNSESDALLVIHYGDHPNSDETEWHHMRVGRIKVQLVASEDYLEKVGSPSSPDDLARHSLLVCERHDRDSSLLRRIDGEPPLSIEPTLVNPSPHLIRTFASHDDGIGWAPNAKLATLLGDTERLVPVLPKVFGDTLDVWISVRRDHEAGPVGVLVKAITRFVGAALRSWD